MINPSIIDVSDSRLSAQQRSRLEQLRSAILLHDGLDSDAYEYKIFEIRLGGRSSVLLYTVVGRKGDEGTAAESFARRSRMLAIGRRGGLTLLNPQERGQKVDGWSGALGATR